MKVVLLLLLIVLFGAQTHQDEIPVTWSLEIAGTQRLLKRGGKFTAELKATIEDGWHIYAISQPPPPKATRISLSAGQAFVMVEAVKGPESRKAFDENFGIDTESYEGKASFLLPLRVAATAPPGEQRLTVLAYYQICSSDLCLRPRTAKVETKIQVAR